MKTSRQQAHGGQERLVLALPLLLFLLLPWRGHAQSAPHPPTFSRWSVQGGLVVTSAGFPFQNLASAAQPSLSDFGAEFRLNKHLSHVISIAIANTWLFNKTTGNAFIAHLDLGYRYIHRSGFYGGLGLDIGSSFLFQSRPAFAYDHGTGTYGDAVNRFSTGYSGFQLSLGYDLFPKQHKGFAFFLRHKFGILPAYFPTDLFPVLPQNHLVVGLSYRFKKRSSQQPQS